MRSNDKAMRGADRTTETVKPEAAGVPSGDETVSSVTVSAAATSASQSPQARADKVQQIAKAVRDGSYWVDLDRLSHAIAADERARAS